MINSQILNFPQLPDATHIKPVPEGAKPVEAADPSSGAKEQSKGDDLSQGQSNQPPPEYSLRLTVDKDPKTGDWVYKAIDRYTGEIVRQLPRQELLDMKKSGNYQAGSVIKTDV